MKESLTMNQSVQTEDFEALFKCYYPFVVRQVMRIISNQEIAEDVSQEVFLKLYHTDRTVIQNLPAWLTQVAYNMSYNYHRSMKRHDNRVQKAKQHVVYSSESTETIVLQREERTLVSNTLIKMKELDRNLILMKYAGFRYEEIAVALQLKKENIGVLLSRSKKKFKKLYEESGVKM